MTLQSILICHTRQSSLKSNDSMDTGSDKEDRKREYNRLAQREFRRRRKEHLKNLEKAQKEQDSEQSEEIERLRYQNEELRRENEDLKAQLYGSSSSESAFMSTPMNLLSVSHEHRQYSASPSISGTSLSAASSPPRALAQDMIPMVSLSLSSSMLAPSMLAYTDHSPFASQSSSMVHPSGNPHHSQSLPETSGYHASQPVGSSFQSQAPEAQGSHGHDQRRASGQIPLVSYDMNRARNQLIDIFHPLYTDPAIPSSPARHLAILRSLAPILPIPLQPSHAQLETHHYYGIDSIASPSLRDRLMNLSPEVAQSFVTEVGFIGGEDIGQLIIWGDEPLNEMTWEFSEAILERWGWLLGKDWVDRANWWRQQRGTTLLPQW